jgi:hypothetical protein
MEGWTPKSDVWVNYGDFLEPDWHKWAETCQKPELLVRFVDPIERLDIRCIIGLSVVLFFVQWDARVSRLYDRVQEYAEEIVVMSPCFESDIGWFWVRGIGHIEFGERWILTEYRKAQADCISAGVKGDQIAYAKAQARELKAIERASWLKS